MADIQHRIIIEAAPSTVFAALVEPKQLSQWWTDAKSIAGDSQIRFTFGGNHQTDMEVVSVTAPSFVAWQCTEGPWQNTGHFEFDLQPDERGTVLKFDHKGWPDADDFFRHCNSKWGFFLAVSLKSYLETGKGMPSPYDPAI